MVWFRTLLIWSQTQKVENFGDNLGGTATGFKFGVLIQATSTEHRQGPGGWPHCGLGCHVASQRTIEQLVPGGSGRASGALQTFCDDCQLLCLRDCVFLYSHIGPS